MTPSPLSLPHPGANWSRVGCHWDKGRCLPSCSGVGAFVPGSGGPGDPKKPFPSGWESGWGVWGSCSEQEPMLSGRRAWEGRTCDPQTPYPREGRGGTPPVMARQSPRLSPPTVTHQAGASLSLTCAVSSPRSFLAFISQMKCFAPLAAGFSFPVLATAPAFTGVALAMLASTPVTSCCLRPMLPLANPSRARLGGGDATQTLFALHRAPISAFSPGRSVQCPSPSLGWP